MQISKQLGISRNTAKKYISLFHEHQLTYDELIDFPNSDYSNLSGGAQLGAVPITFQLIFDTYSQTWHKAPKQVIMKGLEYLEVEQKLHKCLQKWQLDYFSPLIRTNVKSQNNNDIGLRVRMLTYTTEYEDYSPIDEEYKEVVFSFKGEIKD